MKFFQAGNVIFVVSRSMINFQRTAVNILNLSRKSLEYLLKWYLMVLRDQRLFIVNKYYYRMAVAVYYIAAVVV